MDNRKALLALHNMEGVGWRTIEWLVRHFSSLTLALQLSVNQAIELGLPKGAAYALDKGIRRLQERTPEQLAKGYEDKGIGWITIWDEDYPAPLRHTAHPPWVLYGQGSFSLLNQHCMGMVGTRVPTFYGKTVAKGLAGDLAATGFVVVSGLARGIDRAAHIGALEKGGKTIGVLGNSLEYIYPRENEALYRQMAREGLLLTEFPFGTPPQPKQFPQRNRIIAGVSLGVVVIEAAARSGSLLTADIALDESRDVFAVPGQITSPKSEGTLQLIKMGAKLVTCVADIIEEYEHRISLVDSAYIKHKLGCDLQSVRKDD